MNFDFLDVDFSTVQRPISIIEIGVNHNGDMDLARKMIREVKVRGGDIVKIQAFVAEEEISKNAEKANYQKKSTGNDTEGQLAMAKALELTHPQIRELRSFSLDFEMPFLCTAFEDLSLKFLVRDLGVKSVKIASSEITNHPFLARASASGVGLILSTGASDLEEVAAAVRVIKEANAEVELILLHCVTEYPAPIEQLNLRAMDTMRKAFGLPVGYSDHSEGILAPSIAAALGACAIEKHFTLDRGMPGPDHMASIEPRELTEMITAVRGASLSLGNGIKRAMPCELPQIALIRKAIVSRNQIRAGHVLKACDLAFKRPSNGVSPIFFKQIVGKKIKVDKGADDPIQWEDI